MYQVKVEQNINFLGYTVSIYDVEQRTVQLMQIADTSLRAWGLQPNGLVAMVDNLLNVQHLSPDETIYVMTKGLYKSTLIESEVERQFDKLKEEVLNGN